MGTNKALIVPLIALLVILEIVSIAVISQNQWESRGHQIELRRTIGLPSIAIGVGYEGTRNPLLETNIRSLYDIPNGHDYVVATIFFGNPMQDETYRKTIRELNSSLWSESP